MRLTLQWIARLVLGAVLLPLLCAAFLVFCFAAICSDRQWLIARWIRQHKWMYAHQPTASGCVPVAESVEDEDLGAPGKFRV